MKLVDDSYMLETSFKAPGKGLNFEVPLLNKDHEKKLGKSGVDLEDFELDEISTGLELREEIEIPNHSEPEVIRHFVRLSQQNYSIDTGFYPLGSCTMKYNPRINESVARLPGLSDIHPYQPEDTIQGALEIIYNLQNWLVELSGLDSVTLCPAAGAHGEYTGIKIIKAAHIAKEGDMREYIIIPDSAHGTNPATAAGCGYKVLTVKTNKEGFCSVADVKALVEEHGKKIAGLMLTNPNTCGKFEKSILEISRLIHSVGAYFYCDGANFNAICGQVRPKDFGVDVMHFNLHKTFSTPHGGGGPGCGPVAVAKELTPYIPTPFVEKQGDQFTLVKDKDTSIGQIKGFYGQFGMMVRALSYMLSYGGEGLAQMSKDAVLSANYILKRLEEKFHIPFPGYCMHECLFTDKYQKSQGVETIDIAKALIEYGFHPMTVYFPLIVHGAMLIEPTETETKETIDNFCDAMLYIAEKIEKGEGEEFKSYPKSTPRRRLDETLAARNPILTW